MSYAIDALVLLRLEGRIGEQVCVRQLADHIGVADPEIEATLNALERSHGVQVQRVAGLPVSGCLLPRPSQDR